MSNLNSRSPWKTLFFLILGFGAISAGAQTRPSRAPETETRNTTTGRNIPLMSEMYKALKRDDIVGASDHIIELLTIGKDPYWIFMQVTGAASPRGILDLPSVLKDSKTEKSEAAILELLLLFSVARGDSAETESLIRAVDSVARVRLSTLRAVGSKAMSLGEDEIAVWAFSKMRRMKQDPAGESSALLAESLIRLGRHEQAVAILDSLLAAERSTGVRFDRVRLARARLFFVGDGNAEDALALLQKVTGRRERTEADLLAAIIGFLRSGNDSLGNQLAPLARARPDLAEANDAFEISRMLPQLPGEMKIRTEVLHALELEFRERWEDAALAYGKIRTKAGKELGFDLCIRGARCWEKAGRFQQAITLWEEAIEATEEDAVALLGKGDCLAKMGHADSADVVFMRLLHRYPESPHAARARSRLLE